MKYRDSELYCPPETSGSVTTSHDGLQELLSKMQFCLKDEQFYLHYIKELKQQSQKYRCALTKEMMTEPIQLKDGHIYEATSIKEWLRFRKISPVTNQKVVDDLDNLEILTQLKEKSKAFARSALFELCICLKQNVLIEETIAFTAEVLSVLRPVEDFESYAMLFLNSNPRHIELFIGHLSRFYKDHGNSMRELQVIFTVAYPYLASEISEGIRKLTKG